MPRPQPTKLFHFTHVDHLATIARDGLLCDSQVHVPGRLKNEVGNLDVKENRRGRQVSIAPGGVVADYVPFYFTARNLMLYQIKTGQVPTYQGGQDGLVFLCTTLERVVQSGLEWVASNRNAATRLADFTNVVGDLDSHVEWELAASSTFNKTPTEPDRPQRHQAELLVHQCVPWDAIMFIGTRTQADLVKVEGILGNLDGHQPRLGVRVEWYF